MAYTNQTPNFQLPQILGQDKVVWTDLNPAFLTIDTQMQANKVAAASAASSGDTAGAAAAAAQTTANSAMTEIAALKNALGTINQVFTPTQTYLSPSNFTFSEGLSGSGGGDSGVRLISSTLFTYAEVLLKATQFSNTWWGSLPKLNSIAGFSSALDGSKILGYGAGNLLQLPTNSTIAIGSEYVSDPTGSADGLVIHLFWAYSENGNTYLIANVWSGSIPSNPIVLNIYCSETSWNWRKSPPLPTNLYPTPLQVNFNDPVQTINVDHADTVNVDSTK